MFQNVETARDERSIRTEHATTQEMEVGLRIGRSTDLAGVVYRTTLSDPIVYALLGDTLDVQDSYLNRRSASTQGIEFRATHHAKRHWISASFSYYQALTPAGDLPETEVPERPNAHLGAPCTKATLVLRQALGQRWWVSARAMHMGRMWTYQPIDSAGTLALTEYPEVLQLGMRVEHALSAINGLNITVGVENLLDRAWYVASPYNNGTYTLPMAGREVVFRLRYRFQL
jgi:outer membrane receptor protein involved in Fe transport